MSDIRTLLARLSAGEITAAVPLLDAFREAGLHQEAAELRQLIGGMLMAHQEGGSREMESGYAEWSSRIALIYWPWLTNRDTLLARCEADCLKLQQRAGRPYCCRLSPAIGDFT